jgi:hypothetical protein
MHIASEHFDLSSPFQYTIVVSSSASQTSIDFVPSWSYIISYCKLVMTRRTQAYSHYMMHYIASHGVEMQKNYSFQLPLRTSMSTSTYSTRSYRVTTHDN